MRMSPLAVRLRAAGKRTHMLETAFLTSALTLVEQAARLFPRRVATRLVDRLERRLAR